NFEVGKVENIRVRGWVRVSEDVADIAGFGYSLDGEAVVYDESFVQDRAAELANSNFPGGQGFNVLVPTTELAPGEHTIDVYVKTSAGKEIKVVKVRGENDIRQVGVTFTIINKSVSADQVKNDIGVDLAKFGGNNPAGTALGDISGKASAITLWGWMACSEKIAAFGYRYENEDPVFNDAFKVETGSDVIAAGAKIAGETGESSRFNIVAPARIGENLVLYGVAKLENGTVIDIWKVMYSSTDGKYFPVPAIIATNIDTFDISGSALTGAGWTGGTYAINQMGFTVDGGKPIFEGFAINREPEPAVKGIAGADAVRFSFNIDCSSLTAGEHTIVLVAQLSDEDETSLPINGSPASFIVNVSGQAELQ
ncbi:MAG: hypothetical protein II739_02275, partial [Clostridia bacterium]|nr:hypothetical protein [Clostridia bacterium]